MSVAAEGVTNFAYGALMYYSAVAGAGNNQSRGNKPAAEEMDKGGSGTKSSGQADQSAKSPMFGEDWNTYFGEKYGQGNVAWKPNSLNDVIQNPQRLYGATQNEVASMLGEGWTAGAYGSSKTGWKFTNGDGMVFYHAGGGMHGGSYYGFSSGATGKVKIVGSDYIPLVGDKATVIYYNGGN
ncbi:hypothetical protein [Lacrimispora sp.]|uniref:hypothetical protein n=1 Tax=Lacrimispora sp. TaxID=2719234 RepID=UPI0028A6A78F|nr:hypothetical protein [Lacrimispora sp.]